MLQTCEVAHDRRDRAGRVVRLDREDLIGDGRSGEPRANRLWNGSVEGESDTGVTVVGDEIVQRARRDEPAP